MLNAHRALSLAATSGRRLPQVKALADLYQWGADPRHGQTIMIVGRSGSQKSGFALWWLDSMGVDTLYFSADMKPFTASARLASKRTGLTTDQVERAWEAGGESREVIREALSCSRFQWSFGSPITWRAVDEELDAYVELHNKFPDAIVFDNLMDFDGAESDYTAQMAVMQGVNDLASDTGSTVLVMHHATDKSFDARADPWSPPSRDQVKGGLSEKPELSLSVALNNRNLEFNIAVIKQRMGRQDPTARSWTTLRCEPELTRFHRQGT